MLEVEKQSSSLHRLGRRHSTYLNAYTVTVWEPDWFKCCLIVK